MSFCAPKDGEESAVSSVMGLDPLCLSFQPGDGGQGILRRAKVQSCSGKAR